jgi:hypothetical protein
MPGVRIFRSGLIAGVCATCCVLDACGDGDATAPDAALEAPASLDGGLESMASDAFVWGYPLVVSQRTFQTVGGLAGVNHLLNQSARSDATTRIMVSPNPDTLDSLAVVDLRSEPVVLTTPDVADRYWTYQFLDAWTNSFYNIGTRGTGGKGGTFVITPPGFRGTLPAGARPIASPTPLMFLLGRFLVKDASDVTTVNALNRTVSPESALTGGPAPAAGPPPPLGIATGTPQDVGNGGAGFFDELGDALAIDPPVSDADRAALARFSALGIGPGLHPAARAKAAGSGQLAALEAGVKDGLSRIRAEWTACMKPVDGWSAQLDIGTYTDDVLLRAAVAAFKWGANVPAETVCTVSTADPSGTAYSGATQYVMHIDAAEVPPVHPTMGFWSLTLYGADQFFVANASQRYSLDPRTPGLVFNGDGSLDFYIQNALPAGHAANWLPAPPGPFTLMLRLYLPQPPVLDGKYVVPAVLAN